jgi:hypothetical protein
MSHPATVYPKIAADAARLRSEGLSMREIARRLGVTFDTVKKALTHIGVDPNKPPPTTHENGWKEDGDSATWAAVLPKPIRTLAEATQAAEVDTAVWFVDRWECTAWTTVTKDADDKPVQTQQHRVKVYLKRIQRRSLQEAQEALWERMKRHAPVFPKAFTHKPAKGETYLAVMGLFDVHVGKYAWGAETGTNYDLDIATTVFLNAVDDLLAESAHRRIGAWLLPLGNDFYHMDNSRGSTFAGTPQDVDGRYAKVIEAGETAVIKAIERMLAVAPVEVVWVPGNHDPTTSYHLARMVEAWFRNAKHVTVDHGPSPRKYFAWGCNLLGLTHGNEEKHAALPSLMATERPKDWANAKCREWLLGHMHRSRQWQTQSVDTHEGTTVRVLRSLSATDSWHHRKGFINSGENSSGAEVYWYSKLRGYSGHAIAYARSSKSRSA